MIGIIGAMENEVADFLLVAEVKKEEKIGGLTFYNLEYENKEFILVKSGVGKVNAAIAATILIVKYQVDLIISTGIAGGMKPLKMTDICLITKLKYNDVNATTFGYAFGQVPGEKPYFLTDNTLNLKVEKIINDLGYKVNKVTSLTSDTFMTYLPDNVEEVSCFEMESCAIAHVASHFDVKTLVLRYISDVIGEESQIENYTKFEDEMAKRSANICLNVVKSL